MAKYNYEFTLKVTTKDPLVEADLDEIEEVIDTVTGVGMSLGLFDGFGIKKINIDLSGSKE